MDCDLARAARRVIITTEEIVDSEPIRKDPSRTSIPFYCVDAVVEVPYGSHPGNMPYLYYSDEEHIAEWFRFSKTEEGARSYFDKYVFGVSDFDGYIKTIGGEEKMKHLKDIELLRAPVTAPWAGE